MRARASLGLALGLVLLTVGMAGCLTPDVGERPADRDTPSGDGSEDSDGTPTPTAPPAVPVPVTGIEHVAHLDEGDARDVEVHEGVAYVGAADGFFTVDLSDPATPTRLDALRDVGSRYVELLEDHDRDVAAVSGAQQETLYLVDVSDPTRLELLASLEPGRTVHGVAQVPGTGLLYNPRGVGDPVEPGIDVVDVSDPTNPEVVQRWPFPRQAGGQPVTSPGCAMIDVHAQDDRAYCPAVDQTYILDISDPTSPEVVGAITNPAINVHHWARAFADHSRLFLADWAAASTAPTCASPGDVDALAGSDPAGAVWLYDVEDPASAQPVGFTARSAPEAEQASPCAPHVLELVDDQPVAAVAWHRGGLVLVDATDEPAVVDAWTSGRNAWSLDTWGGLVVAGNDQGGVDVLRLTGE